MVQPCSLVFQLEKSWLYLACTYSYDICGSFSKFQMSFEHFYLQAIYFTTQRVEREIVLALKLIDMHQDSRSLFTVRKINGTANGE